MPIHNVSMLLNETNTKTLTGFRVSSVSTRVMTDSSVAMITEVNPRAKTPARRTHFFRIMEISSLKKKEEQNWDVLIKIETDIHTKWSWCSW